jgi:hypothetical protein
MTFAVRVNSGSFSFFGECGGASPATMEKQISLVVLMDHFGAFVGQLGNAPFALVIHAAPLVLENRSFFHSGRGIASGRGQAAFTAS